MGIARLIVAVVLFVLGAVWIGQGLGMIGGSFMSGSSFWAIVGAVLVVIALWLAIGALRGRAATTSDEG